MKTADVRLKTARGEREGKYGEKKEKIHGHYLSVPWCYGSRQCDEWVLGGDDHDDANDDGSRHE